MVGITLHNLSKWCVCVCIYNFMPWDKFLAVQLLNQRVQNMLSNY